MNTWQSIALGWIVGAAFLLIGWCLFALGKDHERTRTLEFFAEYIDEVSKSKVDSSTRYTIHTAIQNILKRLYL